MSTEEKKDSGDGTAASDAAAAASGADSAAPASSSDAAPGAADRVAPSAIGTLNSTSGSPGASSSASDSGASTTHLSLKVKDQETNEVFFKVKRTTKLKKLMDAYCTKVGVERRTIRFLFDGERISDDATPQSLGMENGDVIDAMVEQQGGCALC